jgi:hypothetical protein
MARDTEAMRHRLQEFEMIERMLTSAEARRERTLWNISECRAHFARRAREISDRMIANDARQAETTSSDAPPAAA